MWVIAGVMNWPPIFYSALCIVLLCKWTIWFPAMVVRHGLHGALDAALDLPRRSGRTVPHRPSHEPDVRRSIHNGAGGVDAQQRSGRLTRPEPKGAAGVGV